MGSLAHPFTTSLRLAVSLPIDEGEDELTPALHDALDAAPSLVRAHLLVSGSAVGLACLVGVPLAVWAAGAVRARGPVLGAVALIQTVPALALLALFYPLLLAVGSGTGLALPALGFLPALLALTLYALLPIVRNGVAGLTGVDAGVREAATGMGMTGRQRLIIVELPLAAPVLMAGVRTAAVWTIGAATLATTVGQPSLGNLIFSGLQTENWSRVLVGCLGSAALALLVDAGLGLMESGLARRSPPRRVAGVTLLAGLAAVALWPAGLADDAGGRPLVVGAKNFAEQYILASAMETRLSAIGRPTERRDDLGSAVIYRSLAAGDVDAYVDYSGTLWANVLGRTDNPPPDRLVADLKAALAERDGVTLLGPLGFENAYALAMKRADAERLGVRSLADLARVAPRLRLAADLEFLSRPEWDSVERAYGLSFADARSYNPTFMYRALSGGQADVIAAFSSDGRIAEQDLVTLTDPKRALPSYDAVLLLSARAARDPGVVAALRPMVDAVGIDAMRRANLMVDRDTDKRTPAAAARWLFKGDEQ